MTEKQFVSLPVRTVFFKLAVPGVLGMLFSSMFFIIDGIFIGRYLGTEALAAVNLMMPPLFILFSVSDMIAVGSSVKVATALGQNRYDKARGLFSASIFLSIALGVLIGGVGLLVIPALLPGIIADASLAALAWQFLFPFLLTLPLIMPFFAADNFLRAVGKSNYSMKLSAFTSILNIFLDWLLLAELRLGIEYAAAATALCISAGSLLSLTPFLSRSASLHFTAPRMTGRELREILYNGGSEFFNNIASSSISIIMNAALLALGGAPAVASYSIVMYLNTLLSGALDGIFDSLQPAVSYHAGARETDRIRQLFRLACAVTAGISMLCMLVLLLFPETLAELFIEEDPSLVPLTVTAVTLFAPSYLFTWFNMATNSFMTALDKPRESMIIVLCGTVIFPLMSLAVLPKLFALNGLFLISAVSGGLTALIAYALWHKRCGHISLF